MAEQIMVQRNHKGSSLFYLVLTTFLQYLGFYSCSLEYPSQSRDFCLVLN